MKNIIKKYNVLLLYIVIMIITLVIQFSSQSITRITDGNSGITDFNYAKIYWSDNQLSIKYLFVYSLFLLFALFYFIKYIFNNKKRTIIIFLPILIIFIRFALLLISNSTGLLNADYTDISIFTKLFITTTYYDYSFIASILDVLVIATIVICNPLNNRTN